MLNTVKHSTTRKLGPKVKSRPTYFALRILSRHPSANGIRGAIMVKGRKIVYRHGSTTQGLFEYEINSPDCVKKSSDKLKMKKCFDNAEARHAPWIHLSMVKENKAKFDEFITSCKLSDKESRFVIIKSRLGSRGNGNYLVKSRTELDKFIEQHKNNLEGYIIEQYKNFSVEYRLHVSELGCFYACRKVLKKDTPPEKRFQRHDDNCSWLVESNPGFAKPSNWEVIVKDCQKILRAMGADVMAFDVKCTSTKNKPTDPCDWIIIESCSAPAFGNITTEKYKEHLPKLINHKYGPSEVKNN